jgi:hypothetical protein
MAPTVSSLLRSITRTEYCQEVVAAIDAMFAKLAALNEERLAVTRRAFFLRV